MKKILCLMLASTTVFALSCSKDSLEESTSGGKMCSVAFAVEDVRTLYSDNGESVGVDWKSGDCLYIATTDGTWGSGYKTEDVKPKIFNYNPTSGLFEGSATIREGKYTFRAQYADASQRTYLLSNSASNRLLTEQSQSGNSMAHLAAYDCMMSESTANVAEGAIPTFVMHHLYSFICIKIENKMATKIGLKSVRMTLPGEKITGIFDVSNVATATINKKNTASDYVNITLSDASVNSGSEFNAYVVVAPIANYSGEITFVVSSASGETYTIKKKCSNLTWKQGTMYPTNIELSNATLDYQTEPDGDPAIEGCFGWAELPAYRSGSNYVYHCHKATLGNKTVRNYSYCFDRNNRASCWVAYPLHACYRQGNGDRNNSSFTFDPDIDRAWQANLEGSSYKGSYDRGHQIPAADRTCNQVMMDQTFYATNMTPQQSNFNQHLWGYLEGYVRNYACSDTLYVVTGAHFAGAGWDSSIASSTTDGAGNTCPTPTHYYKVLLRTKSGSLGKPVWECSANELKCIGFFLTHANTGSDIKITTEYLRSVAEIEAITGFEFFTNVPNAPKGEYNASDWGIK